MSLGGGTFTTQNKVLPGAYLNFISTTRASAVLSERGYAAMGVEMDWGAEDTIITVENGEFQKNSLKIFGYDYTHEKLRGLRELFLHATTLYVYRLTSGGTKAMNTYATAKYGGTRGNDLKVVIRKNADIEENFDVLLYLGTQKISEYRNIASAKELIDNDFVQWKKDAILSLTAGEPLVGGTNGTVSGASHQRCLDLLEGYSFNTLGCTSSDDTIKSLYIAYNKRMRDEVGAKFQLVVYKKAADYMGVVNVTSATEGTETDIVYWVTGALAGCPVNKSLLNKKYNGEYHIQAEGTQTELEKSLKAGEFRFHKVGDDIRILSDINSFVSISDTMGEVFQENQTVRVCDQIANDIANLFTTRYLGVVPNDKNGRIALQGDISDIANRLMEIRAIEEFSNEDIQVEQGKTKKDVEVQMAIEIINAMSKLYMTVSIN